MTINEAQDQIIEDFSLLDDWMDRYQMLIDMGSEQQPLPEAEKNEQNLIPGCQSRLWLERTTIEGRQRQTTMSASHNDMHAG